MLTIRGGAGIGQLGALIATIALASSRLPAPQDTAAAEQAMYRLNDVALSHVRERDYTAAARAYEEALQMKPEPGDLPRSRARRWVQNNYAWLLATAPDSTIRDGARALALAEQLVAWKPKDAAYLDTFAAALAELGRFDDAVKAQRASLAALGRRHPSYAEYQGHLRSYESRQPWRNP